MGAGTGRHTLAGLLAVDVETYDFCEGMTADTLVEPVPTITFDSDSDD